MAIRHGVTDTDKHFIIDPVTRTIKNESGKLVLIQYDHNSERFTFECPRYVDTHDMSLCNRVEIHYINTGTGNSRSTGVYETNDLQISPDDQNVVTCSWLVSQNATRHVGKLNFIIRFACIADDYTVEYAWNTSIYSDIVISKSIYNGEEFIQEYVDVLEMWKQDLYAEGLKFESVEQTVTSTEDSGINIVTMKMTDGSEQTIQIQNGSRGSTGPIGISIKTIERTSGDGSPGTTDTYTITLTDDSISTFQVYNGDDGSDGNDGISIVDIVRTSGNGAPGTTDTYTISLTDGTTSEFQVYNGSNGSDGNDGISVADIVRTSGDGSPGTTDTYTITLTDGNTSTFQVYNGTNGSDGNDGNSITNVTRTSGNGAPGTIDTYTITLTDGSTSTFQVYNGANGKDGDGSGDMTAATYDPQGKRTDVYKYVDDAVSNAGDMSSAVYDPQGKNTDIFKYVDDIVSNNAIELSDSVTTESSEIAASSTAVKVAYDKAAEALEAAENVSIDADDTLSDISTNPVQNKVVSAALDDKQTKTIGVEITETICEDVVFDDSAATYTLPSAITLDSDAYYYIDCKYYEGNVDEGASEKYSLHTFTRLNDSVVKWASNNDEKAIILNETGITNNWRSAGHTNVISIYKVKIVQDDPLLIGALHLTGYKTVAPGGYNASAEGHKNMAIGYATHAEGRENRALGDYSHVEGAYNYAYGQASHAQGYGTVATTYAQHVEGAFNIEEWENEYLHIVGNGTSDSDRSNAHTIDWNGNGWYYGSVGSDVIRVGKTHMIKSLGGLNVGTYYDALEDTYKDGTYHRMWRLRFPAGVDVCCRLRVTLHSSYRNVNASGSMSKMLNIYFEGETIYNNTGYYDSLSGAVEQDFRISEAIYNSEVGAWEILIWQKMLNGDNGAAITLEGWGDGNTEFNIMNEITLVDVELTQDTTYTASCYNAESSNTRTITWDDTPVLESPYGKKIATVDDITEAISASITGAIEGSY